MDEAVESEDESWNQRKRSAAETCFNIAVEKVKLGNQKEAELYLLRAVKILDTMDHYGMQKDNKRCSPFGSVDEILKISFRELLRRKNIPASENRHFKSKGATFVSSSKAEEILKSDYGEGYNQDTVADLNGNERTGDYSNNTFVKFSYADPRASCMETLGSSLFDSDNDSDEWNRPSSDSPLPEPEEMDRANPSLSTSSEARASLRIAVGNFCFTLLHVSKSFMKRALICLVELAKVVYEKLIPVFNSFWSIFLLALSFVFLIACCTLAMVWQIIKTILGILVFLSRLVFGNSNRVQYPPRWQKQKPYINTKELPKTSGEAVHHLLACENNDNFYETLLVDENAPQEDIKKNYKRLALLVHPDKLGSSVNAAESAIRILNAAYEVLGDKPKREQYDQEKMVREFHRLMSFLQSSVPCSVCGGRHVVIKAGRHPMSGRYCSSCCGYHRVYDGEAWIESSMWTKSLYFCKADDFFGPQVYKYASWSACESAQFGKVPVNAHHVFIRFESKTHNNYSNQHETKRRCPSGKKYSSRKYKK